MTAAGGDAGRGMVHDLLRGGTFRSAIRGMFQAALERLSADGVVGIAAEDLPGLVDQVRETADPKFGD